jgi:hypothetical protein
VDGLVIAFIALLAIALAAAIEVAIGVPVARGLADAPR